MHSFVLSLVLITNCRNNLYKSKRKHSFGTVELYKESTPLATTQSIVRLVNLSYPLSCVLKEKLLTELSYNFENLQRCREGDKLFRMPVIFCVRFISY